MAGWFTITAFGKSNATVAIYDEIGSGGVTAQEFNAQLGVIGAVDNLTLRINSPGGDLIQASAIYTMLQRLRAAGTKITVYIDGLAASAASFVAMASDTIVMPANAFLMLHDPSTAVVGNASDLKDGIASLERMAAMMARAYATKSGLSASAVAKIMKSETWFTAQEAVDAGFADVLEGEARIAAKFDLSGFAHPPGSAPAGTLDVDAAWAAFRANEAKWVAKGHSKPPAPIILATDDPTERHPRLNATPAATTGTLDAEAIMANFRRRESELSRGGRK